jgi:tetratricopeptide (TPR) repeat protein
VRDGIAAYDAGLYPEALTLFEAVDAEGAADGLVLYRMAYCYSAVQRDRTRSQQTYERALSALEGRVATATARLEEHFYLVNALLNLGRPEEAKVAAARATEAVESCAVAVGPDGTSAFRVGKLYGDSGNTERQAAWYRRALAQFDSEPSPPPAYIERAVTALASFALEGGDWDDAAARLERLHGLYPDNSSTLLRLYVAQALSGDFDGASESLRKAREAGGARSEDIVYLEGMLKKTRRIMGAGHPISVTEPDGRTYPSLSRAELEERIRAAITDGRELIGAPAEEGSYVIELRGKQKRELKVPGPELLARIDTAQARLLMLSFEIVRRDLSMRETAFAAGAAPLILHDWRGQWIQAHRDRPGGAPSRPAESTPRPGPDS